MQIKKIETPKAMLPKGSPHSQAMVANGFVFTQGVIALTPEGVMEEGDLDNKVRQIMENIENILLEANSSLDNVVKATIFVTDMKFYAEVNNAYKDYFADPYPARETVCVKELPLGAEIEMSVIAVQDE